MNVEQLDVSYNGTQILKDLTLELNQGEILGIVGESGSGKSTLLKTMMGILGDNGQIDHGKLEFDGIDLIRISKEELRKLRGTRLGMVFQHPGMAFNPIRKIGVQFLESMRSHGKVEKKEAIAQILDIFQKLSLRDGERILNSYPFELSGGMNQRVAIALAMVMHPEILLADEPTSALDVTVQAQCVKEMMDLRDQLGTTIVIVTHNMGVVSYMADKIAVMYAGHLIEYGRKTDVLKNPQHPYTKALIGAIPVIGGGKLSGIPGCPPVFGEIYDGCPFAPRCAEARPACSGPMELGKKEYANGHWTLCPYGCR
ncbi:MAG: ABC transporter ATP-binding protein [Oscillospiraceae bacterium]|nr:ABC transporter ATP-binding protein [Oscillospiraceae bacterium]